MLCDNIANWHLFAGLTDEQLATIEKSYLEEAIKKICVAIHKEKGPNVDCCRYVYTILNAIAYL